VLVSIFSAQALRDPHSASPEKWRRSAWRCVTYTWEESFAWNHAQKIFTPAGTEKKVAESLPTKLQETHLQVILKGTLARDFSF
jgi:hypothetical protein